MAGKAQGATGHEVNTCHSSSIDARTVVRSSRYSPSGKTAQPYRFARSAVSQTWNAWCRHSQQRSAEAGATRPHPAELAEECSHGAVGPAAVSNEPPLDSTRIAPLNHQGTKGEICFQGRSYWRPWRINPPEADAVGTQPTRLASQPCGLGPGGLFELSGLDREAPLAPAPKATRERSHPFDAAPPQDQRHPGAAGFLWARDGQEGQSANRKGGARG